MSDLITPGNITFVLGLLAVIFSVFLYFKNPQEALDKRQAIYKEEAESKATILAKQLQWEKDSNERRFKELNDALAASSLLASNHVAHMDVKLDNLTNLVNSMNVSISKEIVTLSTKLEERFSRKS